MHIYVIHPFCFVQNFIQKQTVLILNDVQTKSSTVKQLISMHPKLYKLSKFFEFIFSSIKVEPILLQNKMVYRNIMSYTEVHNK